MRRSALVAILSSFCLSSADAGTITQAATFHFATHGTTFTTYNQLSPSLAPLNSVIFNVKLDFAGGLIYSLVNTTGVTQTFNVTETTNVGTDGGSATAVRIESITMPAGQLKSYVNLPSITANLSMTQTAGMSNFVGTSVMSPGFGISGSAIPSIGGIQVTNETFGLGSTLADGSETVTYLYGTTFSIPEPSSLVMMLLGLAPIAMIALRRL